MSLVTVNAALSSIKNKIDNLAVVSTVLKLQSKTITSNGTHEPDAGYDAFSEVKVEIPTSGLEIGSVLTASKFWERSSSSSLKATGIYIDIPAAGTYEFQWCAGTYADDNEYPVKTRLYKTTGSGSATAVGTQTSTGAAGAAYKQNIYCEAGSTITLYISGVYEDWDEVWYGEAAGLIATYLSTDNIA